jgi:hypothetical protein
MANLRYLVEFIGLNQIPIPLAVATFNDQNDAKAFVVDRCKIQGCHEMAYVITDQHTGDIVLIEKPPEAIWLRL